MTGRMRVDAGAPGSAVAGAPGWEVELGGHAAEDVVGACEEVVREAARHVANLVEAGQGVRWQVDVEEREVAGELLGGARAEDRDAAALGAQPRQRNDCGAESEFSSGRGD